MDTSTIIEAFKGALPDGDIMLDPDDDSSFNFNFQVGASTLNCWAFIVGGEDCIIHIYCTNDAAADFVEPLKDLAGELNRLIPFGSYQSTKDGMVTYRTHFFSAGGNDIQEQIATTLQYSRIFMREHLPAILAVSTGLISAEVALTQLKSKSPSQTSAE